MAEEVTPRAIFDCLRQLMPPLGTSSGSSAKLFLVELDERERFISLLNEAYRVANGALVDAALCGNGVILNGVQPPPDLVAAVEDTLLVLNSRDNTLGLSLLRAPD